MTREHDPDRKRMEAELSIMRFSPIHHHTRHAGHAMDAFTRSMLETALWSSTDNADERGGEPLDKNYGISDFDPRSRACLERQANKFQFDNLVDIKNGLGSEMAGHDFWLTRNHHGAGFWDGDWEEPAATRLTKASKRFGEVDLYVGDDGKIYASGCEGGSPRKRRARKRHIGKGHRRPGLRRASPRSHTRSAYRAGRWGGRYRISCDEHMKLTEEALHEAVGTVPKDWSETHRAEARILQHFYWEKGRSPDATANAILRTLHLRPKGHSPRHASHLQADPIARLVHKTARKIARVFKR